MVHGNLLVLLERDAVQAVGQSEDAVDDLVQLEVGPQHLRVDVELLHLQLVRVEASVPGHKLFLRHLLQLFPLFLRRWFVGLNQVVQ